MMDIKVVTDKSAKLATVTHFPLEGEEASAIALTACTKPFNANLHTWHRCLGHLNSKAITHMLTKVMIIGMEITDGSTIATPCEPCIKGKQTCAEIHKSTETRSNIFLGCVFSDVQVFNRAYSPGIARALHSRGFAPLIHKFLNYSF